MHVTFPAFPTPSSSDGFRATRQSPAEADKSQRLPGEIGRKNKENRCTITGSHPAAQIEIELGEPMSAVVTENRLADDEYGNRQQHETEEQEPCQQESLLTDDPDGRTDLIVQLVFPDAATAYPCPAPVTGQVCFAEPRSGWTGSSAILLACRRRRRTNTPK